MKHFWCVLLLLAAACASAPPPLKVQLNPMPSEPGAFDVSDLRGEPETRRYRVKPEELLAASFKTVFDGRPSDGTLTVPPSDPIESWGTAALSDAARLIRGLVAPESWDADPRRAIYVEKDEIVARHVPAVLTQVERLIETLKAHRLTLVRLHVRYFNIPKDDLRIIRHLPALREGLGGVVSRREIEALIPMTYNHRIMVTQTPNLTLYHGQLGVVTIGSRFAYIKSYKSEGPVYDPAIDLVTTGVEIQVRAVANGPDSDRFRVDTSVEVRDLNSITNVLLQNYVLLIPTVLTSRSAGQFTLGPDQAAVLLAPPVRSVNGILGGLGGPRSESDRMTLIVVELDRVE